MLYYVYQYIDDPRLALVIAIAFGLSLLVGLSFHEFSHALIGDALGDPLPRRQGRLSLNPREHLDPLGTLMLLFAPFGWAKPVQVNPMRLRLGPNLGMAVVAVAGPLSNFLLAAAFGAALKSGALPLSDLPVGRWGLDNYLAFLLYFLVLINVTLGVFNLLPIPPLDGSRVAMLIPGEVGEFFRRMDRERWGFGILFLLLALPFLTGGQIDIIGAIINPIRSRLFDLFVFG